ncbi:transporter [Flavobacterium defluvii]|uniref:Putative MetA-pathway of phenol degradation n=1 Tax=Flavobacterium defluvii TaxID=370979 RepID=A0A1M5IY81_9FLAO|nr:transporter [Flavobacterium defluvii]SHG33221.1 Putative MetA-pathway of phenol degradation [Flavobacterium defluvii]
MKLLPYIIFITFLLSSTANAQQIQTDRPNETESPFTVPAKHLQIESGFHYEKQNGHQTIESPQAVLRYGIFKNAELRFETAFQFTKENGQSQMGIQPSAAGFKYHVLDHKGGIPDLALLGRVFIPWMADKAFQEDKYSPELRLLAQHEVSSKAHIGYNAGVQWLPNNLQPEYIYTFSADHAITKKIKLVVETYGTVVSHHHAENMTDAALLFILSSDVQLDITAGTGLMHADSQKFAAAGLSIKI